jgi:hypothetical protein
MLMKMAEGKCKVWLYLLHVLDIFYLLTWNGYTGYSELLVSYQIYMTLFVSCQPYLLIYFTIGYMSPYTAFKPFFF